MLYVLACKEVNRCSVSSDNRVHTILPKVGSHLLFHVYDLAVYIPYSKSTDRLVLHLRMSTLPFDL
jgi:hypothetical protein